MEGEGDNFWYLLGFILLKAPFIFFLQAKVWSNTKQIIANVKIVFLNMSELGNNFFQTAKNEFTVYFNVSIIMFRKYILPSRDRLHESMFKVSIRVPDAKGLIWDEPEATEGEGDNFWYLLGFILLKVPFIFFLASIGLIKYETNYC